MNGTQKKYEARILIQNSPLPVRLALGILSGTLSGTLSSTLLLRLIIIRVVGPTRLGSICSLRVRCNEFLSVATKVRYEPDAYISQPFVRAHPSHLLRRSFRHTIHSPNRRSRPTHHRHSPQRCSLQKPCPLGLPRTRIQCQIPPRRHSESKLRT